MRFRICVYLSLFIGISNLEAQEGTQKNQVKVAIKAEETFDKLLKEEILLEYEEKKDSFLNKIVSFFRRSAEDHSTQTEDRSSAEWLWIRVQHTNSGIGLLSGPVIFTQLPTRSTEELSPGGTGGGIDLDEEVEALKPRSLKELAASYAALRADTTWLGRYKDVCSSSNINPYTKNWSDFKDTLNIELYNPLKTLVWHMPLPKMVVTSDFGMRRYRWHYGIDIRLHRGDSVQSSFYGIVRLSGYQRRGFGHYIVVHHYNGLETIYSHLSKRLVKAGEIVRAGDAIGLGGNTGRSTAPHLHFEVRYEGLPINPNELFDFEKSRIRARNFRLTPHQFSYLKQAKSIQFHRVRRGQTLSHISRYYGVSISRLCRLNHISRRSIVRIGQKIRVR